MCRSFRLLFVGLCIALAGQDLRSYGQILSWNAKRQRTARRSPQDRTNRDVDAKAMPIAVLLGGIYDAGRLAISSLRRRSKPA